MSGPIRELFFVSLFVWSGEASAGPAGREVLVELHGSLQLSVSERVLLADEIDQYESLGGALGHVRNTIWVSTLWGCREECLSSVVVGMNYGLEHGLDDQRAADLVLEVLRYQLDARGEDTSAADLGHLVVSAISSRIGLFDLCEAISAR